MAEMLAWKTEPSNSEADRVVVCLCTKDRPKMFRRCLDSLLSQRISDGALNFHLLIVDNSADGGERNALRSYQNSPVPIRYVHEPRPGIPVARNAALNALQSLAPDWVVFIDDDEIAPADWIVRLHQVVVHYDADVAACGVVQLQTANETQSGAQAWQPPKEFGHARRRQTCPTCNVIFRASLVTGPSGLRFDESMQFGGSDVEFFMRARQQGAEIFHIKDAFLFEEYPSERTTFVYGCKRAFRVGTSTNYRYIKNYGGLRGTVLLTWRALCKTFTALGSMSAGIVVYPFDKAFGKRNLNRGLRSAVTAFGFIGPLLGIRPNSYW